MTVIGTAELEIRGSDSYFSGDVTGMSRKAFTGATTEGTKSAAHVGQAFKMMWNSASSSAMGAFAPVADLVSHVESVSEQLHSRNRGLQLTALGSAGIGVGAGLQVFASREQTAQAQLSDAVASTGHSYEEYRGEIEKTVKTGEHYGLMASQTLDILNRLTIATHSPAKALQDYMTVLNAAAIRHISATSAAQMLGSAYAGNTRIFRMFGIDISSQHKALAAQTTAQKAHTAAVEAARKANERLQETEAKLTDAQKKHAASASSVASAEASVASASASAEFNHGAQSLTAAAARSRLAAAETHLSEVRAQGNGTTALSVSQEIQLKHAHEAVDEAEKKVRETTRTLAAAHRDAAGAAKTADDAMGQLSTRLKGQADDAANTFTGRMKALGAAVEDDVSTFGSKWGPTLTMASTAVTALGSGMTIAAAIAGRYGAAGRMSAAATRGLAEAQGVQATAAAASTEAEVALTAASRTLAEVDGTLAGTSAAAATGIRAQGGAAVVAAGEMRTLTVAETGASVAAGGLLSKLGGLAAMGALGLVTEGGNDKRLSDSGLSPDDLARMFGVKPKAKPGNTGGHQGFGLSDFGLGHTDFSLSGLTGGRTDHVTHAYLNDMRGSMRDMVGLLALMPAQIAAHQRRTQVNVRVLPEELR
jgi:hypothetical protein